MADVVMPRLSDSMEEGTILAWMKQVGDEIEVGDEIVEIETDKANMAYESDVAGTLTEILAEEGETLPIGSPIARVGGSGEGQGAPAAGPVEEVSPTVLAAGGSSAPRGTPAPAPPAGEAEESSAGSTESGDSESAGCLAVLLQMQRHVLRWIPGQGPLPGRRRPCSERFGSRGGVAVRAMT